MFSSLRTRLWLSYALLIATALGVVALVLIVFLFRNPLLYRQTFDRLRAAEQLLAARSEELLGQPRPTNTLERVSQLLDVRVVLFGPNGSVLIDTHATDNPSLSLPRQTLLPRAIPIARDANGKGWLYTLRKLPDGNWLMVAAPRAKVPVLAVLTDELLPPLLEGGFIALLLSLVLAFVIARWVADPLQQVIAVARNVPAEQANAVPLGGPREVQDLTRAFNAMVSRVQNGQKSQRDFVANVSHELKTPLTSIQGFAQAILDGTADSREARKQAAEVIYNEAGRMHRMVSDLLDLARLDAGTADLKMSPLEMAALVNSIVEKFAPLAAKAGVSLAVEAPGDLPALIGDGDRLAQVFTNLVDNALKFTPRGGDVTLRAARVGGEMEISVSDTGPGIPSEALPRIFDRFYQADSSRQGGEKHGAGLGLAIAREIVAAHGGTISVRSRPGVGTTFLVRLPLTQPNATTLARRKS